MKGCWILSEAISVSIEMILWFLHTATNCIYWFMCVEPSCVTVMKTMWSWLETVAPQASHRGDWVASMSVFWHMAAVDGLGCWWSNCPLRCGRTSSGQRTQQSAPEQQPGVGGRGRSLWGSCAARLNELFLWEVKWLSTISRGAEGPA